MDVERVMWGSWVAMPTGAYITDCQVVPVRVWPASWVLLPDQVLTRQLSCKLLRPCSAHVAVMAHQCLIHVMSGWFNAWPALHLSHYQPCRMPDIRGRSKHGDLLHLLPAPHTPHVTRLLCPLRTTMQARRMVGVWSQCCRLCTWRASMTALWPMRYRCGSVYLCMTFTGQSLNMTRMGLPYLDFGRESAAGWRLVVV